IEIFLPFARAGIIRRRARDETVAALPGMRAVMHAKSVIVAILAAHRGGATVACFLACGRQFGASDDRACDLPCESVVGGGCDGHGGVGLAAFCVVARSFVVHPGPDSL